MPTARYVDQVSHFAGRQGLKAILELRSLAAITSTQTEHHALVRRVRTARRSGQCAGDSG